jgi:hypothetical protein
MVSFLAWDVGSSPVLTKPKTMKLVCVASPPLGTIMCPSGATCLSADCNVQLASTIKTNPTKRVGLLCSGPHYYPI